jgi:hypothetical protein
MHPPGRVLLTCLLLGQAILFRRNFFTA